MKDSNYITIQGWMITQLKLKGAELLSYAIIYGFSQDEQSVFSGTLGYLAEWVGVTKQSICSTLKKLVQKKLIIKIEKVVNGITLYDYKTNLEIVPAIKETLIPIKETLIPPIKETLTPSTSIYNNYIYNNNYKEKSNINVTYKENQEMASSMPVPPEVAPTNNSKTANDYFDKFMEWWNTVLIAREENEEKNITKILVGSNARKAMFRSRWVDTRQFMTGIRGIKNPAPDQIFEFMTKGVIGYNYINSEFLQGKIKGNFHSHGYRFEFDSVFRPSMWTKLLENKFFNSDLKRPID